MSARFHRHSEDFAAHCVSHPHPVPEDSAGFLNDHRTARAHRVSHRPEPKSGRHRARPRRHRLAQPQPQPQPIPFILRRVLWSPRRACSPVSLSLTRRLAAHGLPITGTCVGLKPASADPTRPLAGHPPQRRSPLHRPAGFTYQAGSLASGRQPPSRRGSPASPFAREAGSSPEQGGHFSRGDPPSGAAPSSAKSGRDLAAPRRADLQFLRLDAGARTGRPRPISTRCGLRAPRYDRLTVCARKDRRYLVLGSVGVVVRSGEGARHGRS
jgi:hypothetical protein